MYKIFLGRQVKLHDVSMKYIVSIDVGLRNLAWCIVQFHKNAPTDIAQWEVADVLAHSNSKAKVTSITTDKAVDMTLRYLRDQKVCFDKLIDSDVTVLIENQPAGRRGSAKMKCTQTAIYCFFRTLYPEWTIQAVSPALKLSLCIAKFCSSGAPAFDFHSTCTRYVQNKQLAVAKVEHLQKYNESLNFDKFTTSHTQKRDDLADCFLQALSFVS